MEIKSTDIADSDTMRIMSQAMRSLLFKGSTFLNRSIKKDYIVVTTTFPTFLFVPSVYIFDGVLHPLWSSRTVNDNFFYAPHNVTGLVCKKLYKDENKRYYPHQREPLTPPRHRFYLMYLDNIDWVWDRVVLNDADGVAQ